MRPIDADALVEYLDQLSESYNEIYDKIEDGNPYKSVMYGKFTTAVETMIYIKRHMPTIDCGAKMDGKEDGKDAQERKHEAWRVRLSGAR